MINLDFLFRIEGNDVPGGGSNTKEEITHTKIILLVILINFIQILLKKIFNSKL